jgi:uncharacterized ferritin-like protein (DUF455 family)
MMDMMEANDSPTLPSLAGLCSYEWAAQMGYTVEQDVERFVRYAWLEKQAMELGLVWLNPTPEWEMKEALSLHVYLDSEHVSALRTRVSEMRNPPPRMDVCPAPALQAFVDELLTAGDTLEKVVGLYGVLKPKLIAAYRQHMELAHPLVDHPTRRMLQHILLDEEDVMRWGEAAIAALTASPEAAARAERWSAHLNAYLQAAGGVMGDGAPQVELPPSRVKAPFAPDFFPARDERFTQQWNFIFPPHEVARAEGVPAEEKTLALMCKRALEMDVPEVMARMICEAQDQPWQYYLDMCRQLWDEARHAMMGTVYLQSHGIDWQQIPLHPGFSLRLNQHMSAAEAHAVLYAIEQSLMPATTGKRYEWETAAQTQDALATLFQDFDWADEVLHVRIGRQWLLATLKMTREAAIQLGQERATQSESALHAYEARGEQVNWWPDFVRRILGQESAMSAYTLGTADPVYRAKRHSPADPSG